MNLIFKMTGSSLKWADHVFSAAAFNVEKPTHIYGTYTHIYTHIIVYYLQYFSFRVFFKLQLLLIKRVECFSRQTSSSLQHTLPVIHQVHLHIRSCTHIINTLAHIQTHTHIYIININTHFSCSLNRIDVLHKLISSVQRFRQNSDLRFRLNSD